MSEFILRIRTTGPAFVHCPTAEIGRILRRLADDLDQHRFAGAWPRPLAATTVLALDENCRTPPSSLAA